MTAARAHALVEQALARALMARDPVLALRRAARDARLPAAMRRALSACDPDGLRLSALLVLKLRFERLMRGSPEAQAWFDRDAAGFARAFRRYHSQVPPTAFFPPAEARLFRAWLGRRGARARRRDHRRQGAQLLSGTRRHRARAGAMF